MTLRRSEIHSDTSLFLLWLPLAVMWMLMAVEQPAVTAVIARMNNAVLQLAAFGLTFSLALFIEGPIVQMLAAGTAVTDSRENYRHIMQVMHIIGWSATLIQAVLCLPAVYNIFARYILRIPEELIYPSRISLITMLCWTLAVGYRRLWQGMLIRHGKSRVIPITMLARISVTFLTLLWGLRSRVLPGAALGGLALSAGSVSAAVVTRIFTADIIKKLPSYTELPSGSSMSLKEMFVFYIPLALVSFLNLGIRPILQAGLARGLLPMESMAIWPVVLGYLFLYSSLSFSSQEVVIARLEGPRSRHALIRFNSILAAVLSLLYFTVFLTPLWRLWFSGFSGLEETLTMTARPALLLAFPSIPLSAMLSLCRGALIIQKRTREVTMSIAVNIAVLLLILFGGISILDRPGIDIVAAAFGLAYLSEFLFILSRRPLAAFRVQTAEP